MSTGAANGAAVPSGIPPEATPLEELLAEEPAPSDYFRTGLQLWDGVPGLGALRERWEGFAAAKPGYAVLAALLAEAEGNPEAALERLRTLPGAYAAWHTARIQAAFGNESAAVPLLEGLVSQRTSPDLAAQALMALTERDCIRGDFAGALARSRAAWAAQEGEGFRIQVLERHVSLLVESGDEKAFVAEQMADLKSAVAARRRTARHVLGAAGEWFTGDKALRDLRSAVLKEGVPKVNSGDDMFGNELLQGTWRGFHPIGPELLKLAGDPAAPLSLALAAAYEMAKNKTWPDSLESWPLLSRSLEQRPLRMAMSLFSSAAEGTAPHAPLMEDLEKRLPPDVTRRVFSLWRRAWSGKATAADAGELIKIIGEAPVARRYVPGWNSGGSLSSSHGWPYPPRLPDDVLIWNLSGARWAGYYRNACRLQILMHHSLEAYAESHPAAGLYGWRHWRPHLPPDGAEPVMHWAWEQLRELREDSPARFEEALHQLTDPGDRVVFAAMTRNKSRLAEWCVNPAFVKQLRSSAIVHAIHALGYGDPRTDARDDPPPGAAAGLVLVEELAGRLGLKVPDLARVAGISRTIDPKAMAAFAKQPMDENLLSVLGSTSSDDAVRDNAATRQIDAIPHPMYGLPAAVPSVARFTRLAGMLKPGSRTEDCYLSSSSSAYYTLGQLLGWTSGGPAAAPLTDELAKFETKHPIKKRAQRWPELLKECADAKPEPPPATGAELSAQDLLPPQKAALARLAAEEKNSHEWHLVYMALTEKDSEKRKALLETFRSRSPLTLGTWLEAEPDKAAPMPPPAPPPVPKTPAEAANLLVEAWSSPEDRRALEPAGALGQLLRDHRPNALNVVIRPFTTNPDQLEKLVAALMEKHDVLAARAAVCLSAFRGQDFVKPALDRAVAAFPDDPEILIAHALANRDAPDARAGFLRGLRALKSLKEPGEGQSLEWCGTGYGMVSWYDAEVAEVIAAFGAKAEPGWQLPADWFRILQGVLGTEEEIRKVKDVPLMLKTVLRYASPIPQNNGQTEPWPGIIRALAAAGQAAAAEECAAAVLSLPRGDLFFKEYSDPFWPWRAGNGFAVSSRKADGWGMLQIAAGKEPARLAERFRQAHTAHPRDENIALAALLARGLAGPLTTSEDLSFLADMEPASLHKAVAVASWMLPEAILPPALCLEAWQADAAREFRTERNGYRNFVQALMYLEKLERAGAGQRVAQLLAPMTECFAELEWPDRYAGAAAEFVSRNGAQRDREAFAAAIATHLERQRPLKTFQPVLAQALYIFSDAPETLPEPVAGMATALLEKAADGKQPQEAGDAYLCFVCEAAVLYPRWRQPVRAVLASRQKGAGSPEWNAVWGDLAMMMKTLEGDLLVPDLQLSLEPGQPGEGSLRWQFSGLMLPPPPPPGRAEEQGKPSSSSYKWMALASTLAGKFDVVILSENLSGSGRRVAARVEKMPAAGEVKLTGLPEAGRLVVHLYGRETPHAAGATRPFAFNASPVVIDTAIAAKPTKHPRGWKLLGEPVALGEVRTWDIRSHSGPLPPLLHLLLLDEDGQVCAAGHVMHQASPPDLSSPEGPEAVVIRQSAMGAGVSSVQAREFSLTVAGPPRRLALALPADDVANIPANVSTTDSEDAAPPPRITLQELKEDGPAPGPASASASASRLEIERIWCAMPGPEFSPPMLSGNGVYAAWLHGRNLFLVDTGKDAGPVVRELPVPEKAGLRSMIWAGTRLRMAFVSEPDQPKPETLIVEINPAEAAVPAKVIRLPGAIEIMSEYTIVAPGFTVLSEQGKLRGVITAEGNLLEPQEDRKFACWRPLSRTSLVCHAGPDGLYPVFDWTTGTLRLTFIRGNPSMEPALSKEPKWWANGDGVLRETGVEQPRTFSLPLRLTNPIALDGNRLAAISDGGVVRLRIVPARPK